MYGRSSAKLQHRLNRHAPTVLLGGFFLFFSVLLYLALCGMPCAEESTQEDIHHNFHEEGKDDNDQSRWAWSEKGGVPRRKRHNTFLVLLILTAPKNYERRDTIRRTWLSRKQTNVKPLFSIGSKDSSAMELEAMKHEDSMHGDILFLPTLSEAYSGLTDKVLSSIIQIDLTTDFQFLMKVDDDSFVRVDQVVNELKEKENNRLYWGYFDGRANVKKRGKWAESEWVLCDKYLPHALGGGYVLSADLVHFIAHNSKYLKKFNSEDVSVGTWLAPLDIVRVHDPRFDTEFVSRGCHNSYIVTHKQTPKLMKEKHNNLKQTGKLCKQQVREHFSYIYNWAAKPSECCVRNDTSVP